MKNVKYILYALLVALSSAPSMHAMHNASAAQAAQAFENTLDDVLSTVPEIEDIRQELLQSSPDLKQELKRLKSYALDNPSTAAQKLQSILLKAAPKKATAAEYAAYVAKLDFLAYMLKYQHDIMQSTLDMLYLLTMQGVIRATSKEHMSLDALIKESSEALAEYEKHADIFDIDGPVELTSKISELLRTWAASENPDINLLAQIYCEQAIQSLVEQLGNAFIGTLQVMVDINPHVISNLQAPESQIIKGGGPVAGVLKMRQDPTTILGYFHINKIRLMKINGIIANHDLANLDTTYPSLIGKLQEEILIYTHTHNYNEKLYALIQREISKAVNAGHVAHDRESFSSKPLPKTLEPLQVSSTIKDLMAIHDLFNEILAPKSNDSDDAQVPESIPQVVDALPQSTHILSKSARKKANKRAKQQAQATTQASALIAIGQQEPVNENVENDDLDAQQTQPTKNKKSRLEKLEEKIARLNVQDEQKETTPQKLSKAQRKRLNKERELERLAQASIHTAPVVETYAIPSMQSSAPQIQVNPVNLLTAKQLVPKATDGSYVHKETATSIIIAGPRNTTVTLQKKIVPGHGCAKKPGYYADDIKLWQQDPNAMILERYGVEYSPYDEELRRGVEIHAFAKTVDDYIEMHSNTCKTNTRVDRPEGEIAICLPGKIRYANGQEEEGYFGYLVDGNNKCFHRMFERKDTTSALAIQLRHHKCFLGYEKLQ